MGDKKWLALGIVAATAIAVAPAARAMGSCDGTWSANALRPLPDPLVVHLVVADDSPNNLDLAARFNDGLQRAGVAVGGTPTAQLRLMVSLDGGLGETASVRVDDSFGWTGGGSGVQRQKPAESQFGRPQQGAAPVIVQLRAELRPGANAPVAWVATLRCTRQDGDDRRLAYDIGTLLGGGLGRRVDQTGF
jgi:hypothetical protein